MLKHPFSAGMGFEVAFKVLGLFFRLYGDGGVNFPRGKFGRVGNMPCIVSS